MENETFENLPLELKLRIIELSPWDLIRLTIVDKKISAYYESEAGQNWFNRISNPQYHNTHDEEGISEMVNGIFITKKEI